MNGEKAEPVVSDLCKAPSGYQPCREAISLTCQEPRLIDIRKVSARSFLKAPLVIHQSRSDTSVHFFQSASISYRLVSRAFSTRLMILVLLIDCDNRGINRVNLWCTRVRQTRKRVWHAQNQSETIAGSESQIVGHLTFPLFSSLLFSSRLFKEISRKEKLTLEESIQSDIFCK
jgi:hypothetical protein